MRPSACPRCAAGLYPTNRFCETCGLPLPQSSPSWTAGPTGNDAYGSWWDAPRGPQRSQQVPKFDPLGRPLADFGSRAAAFAVDWAILLVGMVILLAFGAIGGGPGVIVAVLACLGGLVAYHSVNGGPNGQTLGMRVFGLRLVDATTGQSIGYGRAFVRWLLQALMAAFIGLLWLADLLWPLWDERTQTLHDKAVGSLVITTKTGHRIGHEAGDRAAASW
jgi:uncharacterized RDD family membrane protein YckC